MKKILLAIAFLGFFILSLDTHANEILYQQTYSGRGLTCNYDGNNKFCGMSFNSSTGFTFNSWSPNIQTQPTWTGGILQGRIYQVSNYNSHFSSGTLIATSENTLATPLGTTYYTFDFPDTTLQPNVWYIFLIYVTDSGSGTNKWLTSTISLSSVNGNYTNRYNVSLLYSSDTYDWQTIIGYNLFSQCSDVETTIDYSAINLPYIWNGNTYNNVVITKKSGLPYEVTYFRGLISHATRNNSTSLYVSSDGYVQYKTSDLSNLGNPYISGSGSLYLTGPSIINNTSFVSSISFKDYYEGICYNQNFYTSSASLGFPLNGSLEDRTVLLGFGDTWPFGECPTGIYKKHAGIDLSAIADEEVYAAHDGTIRAIFTGNHAQWADAIIIEDDNQQYTTVYWHVIKLSNLNINDHVTKGQQIATVADLGGDTHFHFGLRSTSYDSSFSLVGALPEEECGSSPAYPAFPENFTDPIQFSYE